MNSNNKILGAPVIINLDGSFLSPTATGEYVAGQLSPDLRLQHLDSFLEQLNSAILGSNDNVGNMLATTVESVREKMRPWHKEVNVQLSVKCSIDPETHTMEYVFDMTAKASAP